MKTYIKPEITHSEIITNNNIATLNEWLTDHSAYDVAVTYYTLAS